MSRLRPALISLSLSAALPACAPTGSNLLAVPANARAAAPQRGTSSSALLYVSDENGVVYVYAYPKGRLVQQLTVNFATGECLDGSSVFVTAYNGHKVYLYAHGASQPSAVLFDPGYPNGCSVDPTTQSLAVANAMNRDAGSGDVAIWKGAPTATVPTLYSNLPFIEPAWCSYDNDGNLFVDGQDYSKRAVSLAELPRGATTFKTISLDISLGWPPGHVQWDGKYITISVQNVVYRFSFSGSSGHVVGSTNLPAYWDLQGYSVVGAWEDAKKRGLVGTAGGSIGFFGYPSGSGPTRTLTENYPFDAVVSPAVH